MSERMDNAIDQLKNMLSTEEGQREIESIISSAQGDENDYNLPAKRTSSTPFNMDAFVRVRDIMDKMQADNDPRVNLLSALRPYISKNRGSHIENAIKIMSLGKLPYLLKSMKK